MDLTGSSIFILQYFSKCWSRKLCEPEMVTAEQCAGLSPSCSLLVCLPPESYSIAVSLHLHSPPIQKQWNTTVHTFATETTSLPNWSAISDLPSCQKAISLRFNGDVWLAWTTYIYHNAGKMPTQWLSKLKQNGLLSLTTWSRLSSKKIKPWGKSKQAGLKFKIKQAFFCSCTIMITKT